MGLCGGLYLGRQCWEVAWGVWRFVSTSRRLYLAKNGLYYIRTSFCPMWGSMLHACWSRRPFAGRLARGRSKSRGVFDATAAPPMLQPPRMLGWSRLFLLHTSINLTCIYSSKLTLLTPLHAIYAVCVSLYILTKSDNTQRTQVRAAQCFCQLRDS